MFLWTLGKRESDAKPQNTWIASCPDAASDLEAVRKGQRFLVEPMSVIHSLAPVASASCKSPYHEQSKTSFQAFVLLAW